MKPKPFAFVLMPFSKKFDDIYALGIKAACDEAGAYCERVDEQIYEGRILDRIYNQIEKADILIADVTEMNPNVFYEIGYAHGLGRNVVLLTHRTEDIPFDLQHHFHIVYSGSIKGLKESLTKRISWLVRNPDRGDELFKVGLDAFIDEVQTSKGAQLVVNAATSFVEFRVSIRNSVVDSIDVASFRIGLVLPSGFKVRYFDSKSPFRVRTFPEDSQHDLHILDENFELLPGEWTEITLSSRLPKPFRLETPNAAVRIFRESGPVDYSFTVVTPDQ